MSVNWVMLTPDTKDIVPLQNETIFLRQLGVKFELDCSNGGYPGAGASYTSKSGTLMLTNQRIVYLCAAPTAFFSSASLPVKNIQDSKLVQSWFSAPVFKAVVMPVPGGGLTQPARLAISFTSGDIHDFDAQYRSLRERSQELDGAVPQHLEQLPLYVPSSSTTIDTTSFPRPSATTSATIPQPAPIPHVQPPPLIPTPTQAQAYSGAGGGAPWNQHPPPPQPMPYPQLQPQGVPSDLPPSYDEIR